MLEHGKIKQAVMRYVPALSLAMVLLAGRFIEPDQVPGGCVFRLVTGIPCMFCGLTHAFHALLLGHWAEAVAFHPLAYVAFGLILFHFFFACLRAVGWKHPRLLPGFRSNQMMVATFGFFTFVWLVRFL